MNTKRWTIFSSIFVAVIALSLFMTPQAMAQEPRQDSNAQRNQPGVRMLLVTAAEELGMTPKELVEDLRSAEGRTLADVANDNHVDPGNIVYAVVSKAKERLDARVANGKMTQEEADERLAAITEKVTEAMNKPLPQKAQNQGDKRRIARGMFKIAADTIGLTPQVLLEELRQTEDASIADIAVKNSSSGNAVVNAIVEKAQERLDARMAEGKMTQEEADERLVKITERVTEVVNSPFPVKGKASQGRQSPQDNQ